MNVHIVIHISQWISMEMMMNHIIVICIHFIIFLFFYCFVCLGLFPIFLALMKSVPLIQLSKAEYSERNIGENGKLQPNNFHFYTANRLCHFGNCWRNFFPSYYFHFFFVLYTFLFKVFFFIRSRS